MYTINFIFNIQLDEQENPYYVDPMDPPFFYEYLNSTRGFYDIYQQHIYYNSDRIEV